ncbi:MAG: DnaA regulatory inactivator Hda [Rhodoferax sp.]
MRQLVLDIGPHTGPTLANFVAGPNAQALQHLRLWSEPLAAGGRRSPVPLYLWGPHGSGKSHLLRAVCAALEAQGLALGWMDSASAAQEYNDAWAAVFMDDVHLYSAAQQHQAFAWFVQAQSQQCAVLAAGDAAPTALPLREDLRTRLGWGHVFALDLLSEAQRRAVLRQAADARGVFLGDEVMDYMLNHFSRDLGSLLELLAALDHYALQTQRAITIPLLKSMLEHS